MLPEGRRVFPYMSVKDNLMMGAFPRSNKSGITQTLDSILARFPRLKERDLQAAGTLSGGEQQMMVIGRSIVAINRDEGVSVLLVEQNSRMALSISQRAYAMATGNVVLEGASRDILSDDRTKAAYHAASMIATRFSVVTTLSRSVPGIEHNLNKYGLVQKCGRVRATNIPVLQLEESDPVTLDLIRREIRAAIEQDQAEAIVLGCAGMVDLVAGLSAEFGLPVIDVVTAGVSFAEALVAAGFKTSKIGAYAVG